MTCEIVRVHANKECNVLTSYLAKVQKSKLR